MFVCRTSSDAVGFQDRAGENEGVCFVTTESKRLERRLAVISQIARVTSASLGLDELIAVAYEAIAPFFNHEGYRVLRYSRAEESLCVLFGVMGEDRI